MPGFVFMRGIKMLIQITNVSVLCVITQLIIITKHVCF